MPSLGVIEEPVTWELRTLYGPTARLVEALRPRLRGRAFASHLRHEARPRFSELGLNSPELARARRPHRTFGCFFGISY